MPRTTLDQQPTRSYPTASTRVPSRPARIAAHPLTALIGILLVSVNMRAAVSAVSPLLTDISTHYGLSSTAGGLLTTLPVLLMGITASFVPGLVRRLGPERVVLGALLLLAAGVGLRVMSGVTPLFAGSIVVGAAIAMLNVTMPGLVKRDFPDRAAMMTGVYSTAMIVGATFAAALSVPMEHAFGGWQGSLASWSVLALVSAALWLPQVLGGAGQDRTAPAAAAGSGRLPGLWRHPLAWQLAVFMGIMSLLAYTLIAWMPTVLTDHGMSRGTAGLIFAFCNLVQVAGAFLVPLAAGRMTSQRLLVVLMAGSYAVGIAGLMIAPAAGAWIWATLLGLAMGGGFGLAMALVVLRAGGAVVASQLSGMSQMVGYFIAACGPVGVGALHQLTGGWTLPLTLLLVCCGVALAAGLGAARPVTLRAVGHRP
ncbi:MFS transporter [Streptacidiphilus sp. PB12-B1b]|uniref:CynX/NimT family MFS transporter n=1 Tax=Streptacidiphilus sp. PB12-B1b TaxID=2705012 RepID=UPI0015FA9259|nr:MFS transporter [Streptacidiphilus sp. PB12-B1b]QMU74497.1 MFS transporter [Streptacidiphilus sp. PB12-B1b]